MAPTNDQARHTDSRYVALVTGAAAAIGQAIAARIASRPDVEAG